MEGEGAIRCVFICVRTLVAKVRKSKGTGELHSELITCQHCSVWEVAPGERCATHKGEIQQLFQRKSSSYISAASGKQNSLTGGPQSSELEPSRAVVVSVHEVERIVKDLLVVVTEI